MRITVRYILENFEGFKVLAGEKGLGRDISTVTVMDAPDIYDWMRGGEFLITTAYIMRDNPMELKDLVINLNKNGASALGIKVGRFIDRLPDEVIEVSNDLDFPIIYIPMNFAFSDVINPILSKIVNAQAKQLLMSEKIHKSFTKLVIDGKGTDSIVDTLHSILNKDVAFLDLVFNKTYIKSESKDFENDILKSGLHRILNTYFTYKVQIDSSIYGYIIIGNVEKCSLEYLEEVTIEHASTVLKLNIQKEISNKQIERKYRDEFIQDLLVNNIKTEKEAHNRASLYGWKFNKGLSCIIFDIDDFKSRLSNDNESKRLENERDKIFNMINRSIRKDFGKSYYTSYSDSIVFLIEPCSLDMDDFKERLYKKSKNIGKEVNNSSEFTLTVGIGGYETIITDVYISFIEAQKAVRIGRSIYGSNNVHIYSDLGVYEILYNISSSVDSKKFCSRYLKNIYQYDKENNNEYMKTLECLVKNDWNLRKTADDLFIHYNTMKYRAGKIASIANIDLNSGEDKFAIEFCLKLINMSQQYSLYMKTNI